MIVETLLFWAIAPVLFGFWARTPYARVLTPRLITWYYRYLVVHTVVVLPLAALANSSYFLPKLMCVAAIVASLYFIWYEYFNASKPDALPIGIKVDAVGDLVRESVLNSIWPHRRRTPASSLADHKAITITSPRSEQTDLARASDIDLGIVGTQTPSLEARGKLWLYQHLFSAQEKTLAAKRKVNEEAALTLRSLEPLHEAIERAQHIRANAVIGDRVRDEFKAEEDERTIRQRERDERAADQDRKAKEAEGKRAAAEAQMELDRRRREARLTGEVAPSLTAENLFRQRAEQIAKYGATGRFMPIAEEMRLKLIAERGGEEHLTDEDLNRIELIFAEARRMDESKS